MTILWFEVNKIHTVLALCGTHSTSQKYETEYFLIGEFSGPRWKLLQSDDCWDYKVFWVLLVMAGNVN